MPEFLRLKDFLRRTGLTQEEAEALDTRHGNIDIDSEAGTVMGKRRVRKASENMIVIGDEEWGASGSNRQAVVAGQIHKSNLDQIKAGKAIEEAQKQGRKLTLEEEQDYIHFSHG